MSFAVAIQPSGHTLSAEADESILEAAMRQGLTLPYGCRDGVCGACRGKVLNGKIDHGKAQPHALSDADREAGFALFCCAQARSDLVIESREVRKASDIPVKTLPARIQQLVRAAPDVMILKLKLPANERLQFLAGQYLDILLKDGKRRSFSLANAPHDDEFLELHVRHMAGGLFTEHVFSQMKEKDILRFNGPHGTFFLREESKKPMVMVAGGTGFAPIKSVVEHAIAENCQRQITVYCGSLPLEPCRGLGRRTHQYSFCPRAFGANSNGFMGRPHRPRPSRGHGRLSGSFRASGLCLRRTRNDCCRKARFQQRV
jgi:CDP-4-dehydro-6-deoxyglucose reductase